MLETDTKKIIDKLKLEVFDLKTLVKSLLFEISFLKQENRELKKEVKTLTNKLSLNSQNSRYKESWRSTRS